MNDLNEARRCLEASLGEDLKKLYFTLLKQWFSFNESITKIQFYSAVQKLMKTEEQLHNHNMFMLALFAKLKSSRVKSATDKGSFELADYTDYVPPLSPTMTPPEYDNRFAASELFLPDSGFISTRISIHVWLNGLDGADDNVSEYLVTICQLFVKNILTAMISKKKGYKIREKKFQFGFGCPIPDPFIRNTNNIMDQNVDAKMEVPELFVRETTSLLDETEDSKVGVMDDNNCYLPGYRPTLESVEQQTAFSYSCGKRTHSDEKLTLNLLYDTVKENPNIVSFNSIHSIYLLKIGLQLEDS